jgi:hypothetical protein
MATSQDALLWVNRLYKVLTDRRPDIAKQFRYFEGEQPLVYATPQWKEFHAERYSGFSDNWCAVVAQAPVDRLRIDGFSLGDVRTAEERELWDDWKRNELPLHSKQGFLASTIAKRSATLVWGGEDDEPVVTWEHPSQIAVSYSADHRQRRAALKAWVHEDTEYATLYLPDEVWKFERPTYIVHDGRTESGIIVPSSGAGIGGWKPRQPDTDDTWPLSNPLGEVPVVEWLNRPLLGGEPLSDISGTMAMQDAVNTLWAYLFTAADHASMAARVVTGADWPQVPVLDKDGQKVGARPAKLEDLAQGRFLFIPGKDARIDQWEAARLDVFDKEIATAVAHIAAQTSTPGHYLLSNEKFANLNGDALTAAETPLATKSRNAAEFYSPAGRDTLRLMAKVRGRDALADSLRSAELQWHDPAMHSLSVVADAATKDRAVGLSLRTILETRYGMSPDRIDIELDRVAAEQSDPVLDRITRGLLDVADRSGA